MNIVTKKGLVLFIVLFFVELAFAPASAYVQISQKMNQAENFEPFREHIAPICIEGNDDFTIANGVRSGSGTIEDPFLISNWHIYVNFRNFFRYKMPGISITNTTAHFIITNCYIHSFGSRATYYFPYITVNYKKYGNNTYGIQLKNVINGKIEKCTVKKCSGCIKIVNSSNICIQNCISERNFCGIYLSRSHNNLIEGCRTNNIGCSICLHENSFNNRIVNCDCYGGELSLDHSSYNQVQGCTFALSLTHIFDNRAIGVHINESNNNTVCECTFLWEKIGVLMIKSFDNVVTDCVFKFCLYNIKKVYHFP